MSIFFARNQEKTLETGNKHNKTWSCDCKILQPVINVSQFPRAQTEIMCVGVYVGDGEEWECSSCDFKDKS